MNINELRASGKLYKATDPELLQEQNERMQLLQKFNSIPSSQKGLKERTQIAQKLFAAFGQGSYIEPPLYANWAGKYVSLGKNVYFNFNCMLVDDGEIVIEDSVLIGPGVTIISGSHPTRPDLRKEGYQFTAAVHLKENCWIGAGSVLLPGVCIGKDSVIGAGSVVTADIPDQCIAAGNPCRVLRKLNEKDYTYYFKNRVCAADPSAE